MEETPDVPIMDDDTPDWLTVTCPSCGFVFNVPYHLILTSSFECPECKNILEAVE